MDDLNEQDFTNKETWVVWKYFGDTLNRKSDVIGLEDMLVTFAAQRHYKLPDWLQEISNLYDCLNDVNWVEIEEMVVEDHDEDE